MKKKYFFTILFFVLCCSFLSAKTLKKQNDDVTDKEHDGFIQLSSIEINIMQMGIKYPGYSFGLDFEKYIKNHIAVSGNYIQSAFFGSWFSSDNFITTSSFGTAAKFYPLHDSLRGPYAGLGAGCDVMFDLGKNPLPEGTQQFFFYAQPEIGYKFYLFNHFMIDTHIDYKFQTIKDKESLPKYYSKYLDNGFHFGVAFKFFKAK